jgi:cell division initiation protein
MTYTPVELRHVKLGRALFGYKRDETEQLLEGVADSFEDVWRDRGELTDKVHELENRLAEFTQRDQLLSAALVAAERAAAEARETARREAELIINEAHQEARSVARGAQGERERLLSEARRIEALLRSALGLVDEGVRGAGGESEPWPERSDTREFQAVTDEPEAAVLPPIAPVPDEDSEDDVQPGRDFAWG